MLNSSGTCCINFNVYGNILAEHWLFGKWMLLNALIGWSSVYLYAPILSISHGLSEAASLRAIENVYLPLEQTMTALVLIITPNIAMKIARNESARLNKVTGNLTAIILAGAVCYTLAVSLFGKHIMHFIYNKEQYELLYWLIPVLGLASIFRAIGDVGIGTTVRACGKPKMFVVSTLYAAVITWTLGFALASHFGAAGAIIGRTITNGIACITIYYLWRKNLQHKE